MNKNHAGHTFYYGHVVPEENHCDRMDRAGGQIHLGGQPTLLNTERNEVRDGMIVPAATSQNPQGSVWIF